MVSTPSGRRLRRSGLAAVAAASIAGGLLAAGTGPASASTPYAGVVINEVESNGDATDWVELYNTTGSAISLSGAILSDSNDSNALALTGTIAAGGYAVFDVSTSFGLGNPDSVRLFEGSTSGELVNSTSWVAHSPTTWGRLPNGTGGFAITGGATRGALNVGPGSIGNIDGVVLNEIEGSADATNGDWVELLNTTGSTIDISGAVIADSDPGHSLTVPASTTLGAGATEAFRVDAPSRPGNFGLGAPDTVSLFQPGDTTRDPANLVDSYSWTDHAVFTFGRNPANDPDTDGIGEWEPTAGGTYGTANNQFTPMTAPTLAGVKINEVKTTGDDVKGDWIEIRNTAGADRTIANAILSDNDDSSVFRVPDTTPDLAPGAVAAFRVDDPAVPGNFGLGDADSARLFSADALLLSDVAPVDGQAWTTHAPTSWGFETGSEVATNNATFGAANDYSLPTVEDKSFIVLNEIDSSSPSGGADFIELRNTASTTIDIGGMVLSDSNNNNVEVIPNSTNLAPGAVYLVNPGFGLGSEDAARLYRDNSALDGSGNIKPSAIPLDHHEWTQHAPGDTMSPAVNKSYNRSANGLGDWVVATATPGTP
ncbi:hypothetical protein GCM10027062_16760 [Nocardioides hungaricus]